MWAIDSASHSQGRDDSQIDRVVLAFGLQLVGPVVLNLPVLGMDAQRDPDLVMLEKRPRAHAVVGERQVADRLAEENLVADGAGLRHRQDVVGVGLMHDAEDAEVTQRLGLGDLLLDADLLGILGRRNLVRHVDDRRDAAADCRGRAGCEVFLVGHAGIAEVDVGVDEAGQDVQAAWRRSPACRPASVSSAPIATILPSEIATPPCTVASGVTIHPFFTTKSAFMIFSFVTRWVWHPVTAAPISRCRTSAGCRRRCASW